MGVLEKLLDAVTDGHFARSHLTVQKDDEMATRCRRTAIELRDELRTFRLSGVRVKGSDELDTMTKDNDMRLGELAPKVEAYKAAVYEAKAHWGRDVADHLDGLLALVGDLI